MSSKSKTSSRPSPRPLIGVALAAAAAALAITLSFGYADHSPSPHGVRIAMVAPAPVRAHLTAALDRAAPGGFTVLASGSARAAADDVRSQAAAGAFILPAAGPVTVVTAAAAGTSQQQVITAALTRAATALHRSTTAADVAPLPAHDRAGLSTFVFELGLLIPSVLGGVGLFLVARRYRIWWRIAAAGLYAVVAACGDVLAIDLILGGLTGHAAALLGLGALGALTFVMFVAACQAAVGLPGTGLAAVALVFIGNAISGATTPTAFLPDGFRQISPWLPNAAIVRAARDIVYFPDQSLAHPLLVLGLWLAFSAIILIAVDLLHLAELRRDPGNAPATFSTSGAAHLKRRFGSPGPVRQTPTPPATTKPRLPRASAAR